MPLPDYSLATMEAATAKKPKKAPKPKAPCKYGPRDPVTGRCPTKSQSAARTASGGSPSSSPGLPSGLAEKILIASGKEAAATAVKRVVPNLNPKISKKTAAAAARATVGSVKKIAGAGVTAIAGAGAGGAALVLAAGTAAFLGTQFLKKMIEDKAAIAARKKNPSYIVNEAAKAYRAARASIENKLGRSLTPEEDQAMFEQFLEPVQHLMPKGGF